MATETDTAPRFTVTVSTDTGQTVGVHAFHSDTAAERFAAHVLGRSGPYGVICLVTVRDNTAGGVVDYEF